jgi:hypothetical protein
MPGEWWPRAARLPQIGWSCLYIGISRLLCSSPSALSQIVDTRLREVRQSWTAHPWVCGFLLSQGPFAIEAQTRVRSRGLLRNRDVSGTSRWTRRRKRGASRRHGLLCAPLPRPLRPKKEGARRLPPWHRDSLQVPGRHAYGLPQQRIASKFRDATRIPPCGHAGWRSWP